MRLRVERMKLTAPLTRLACLWQVFFGNLAWAQSVAFTLDDGDWKSNS
jgi:hypothetical protein